VGSNSSSAASPISRTFSRRFRIPISSWNCSFTRYFKRAFVREFPDIAFTDRSSRSSTTAPIRQARAEAVLLRLRRGTRRCRS
jgi:hypothetical protein